MTNTAPAGQGQAQPARPTSHARKALAYATDRQAVAAAIGEGVEIADLAVVAASNPWGMPDDQNGYVDFDLDQAKAEVAAYKQDTGATSLSFTLSGLPGIDDIKVLQLVQSQWKDAGIDVSIETLEQTAYITKIVAGDYQAAFFRNYGYADPDRTTTSGRRPRPRAPATSASTSPSTRRPSWTTDLNTGRAERLPQRRARPPTTTWSTSSTRPRPTSGSTARPYSIIADPSVQGPRKAASEVRFGNFQPKTWWADLWRDVELTRSA